MAAPRRACPKCGSHDVAVRYVEAGGDRWHLPRLSERCREAAEHLHWTCRDCEYHWLEPPQDARRQRED